MFWDFVAATLLIISLPGTIELAFLTISAWLPSHHGDTTPCRRLQKLAVVVPAHDEAATIAATLQSLRACDQPPLETAIVVVADNCSDQTAAVAAGFGARVLVRNDDERRGKGYALDHAFGRLLEDKFDAFIVIDADTVAEKNLLVAFTNRFNAGADALQCLYRAPDTGTSPTTRMRNILWFAFNVLRPRARSRWGLSVGIYGNGFGITGEALRRVPYDVGSITEDLEYHLRLVSNGIRVGLVPATTVWSELPDAASATESQRARWEGGRAGAILEWSPRLLKQLSRGRLWALEPLLDLWLLPLSFHAMLLVPLLVIPVTTGRIYALIGFLLLAGHALTAVGLGWHWKDALVLLRIPFYIFWKVRMLPQIMAKAGKQATWVRTDRANTKT